MALEDIGVRVLILGLGEFRRGVGTARDDIRGLEGTIRSVSETGTGLGTTLTKIGSGMIGLGRTMTLGITTPLSLLIGSLTNAGIKFEDTFAGVAKTVDGVAVGFDEIASMAQDRLGITVTNMDEARQAAERMGVAFGDLTDVGVQVREEFRQVALDIPISAEELNKLGEIIGALGVKAGDIAEVTKLVAELGVATDISAEDAASGLVKMFNIVGEKGDNLIDFLKSAGSALVALGNNSVSTEGEILALATRLSAAGDRAHFSSQELLAWATTISDVGSRAEAGGTAVSRAINEMLLAVQTGDESLSTFAQVTGQSVDSFVTSFKTDASGALLTFIKSLNDGIEAGHVTKDMLNEMGLGGIRALDVLGRLSEATDLYTKNLNISNTAWSEQIALEEEAEKRFQTVASQIQILKNVFTDLGITVFDLVKDDIKNLIEGIKTAVTWFKNLSPAAKRAILVFAGIAAAIGPVLIIVGGLVSILGTLITAVTAMASPVGLAALAVVGLGVALGTLVGWDNIINGISTAFDNAMLAAQGVMTIIDQLSSKKATIADVIMALAAGPKAGPAATTMAPSSASEAAGPMVGATEDANSFQDAINKLNIPPQFVADMLILFNSTRGAREAFDILTGSITNLLNSIASNATFQDITTRFPNDIKAVGDAIFGFVNQTITNMSSLSKGFSEGFAPLLESAGPGITKILDNLETAFAKLAPLFGAMSESTSGIPWEAIGTGLGKIAGLVFNGLIDSLVLMTDFIPVAITNITNLINIISDVIDIVSDLASGTSLDSETMRQDWEKLTGDVSKFFTDAFDGIKKMTTDFIDTVIGSFQRLYNTLVGHSIVPDLVSDILTSFTGMKDGALELFTKLAEGAGQILSGLFGGGGGEAASPTMGVSLSADQIAMAQQAIVTLQTTWSTFVLTMNTQLNEFFTNVILGFTNLGITAAVELANIGSASAALAMSMIFQFQNLQETITAIFSSIGTAAAAALSTQVVSNMTAMVTVLEGIMKMLEEYWFETIKHMVGHWLDFVAAANALSAEWAVTTIAIFDKVHNEGVGKIHEIRNAWKSEMHSMATEDMAGVKTGVLSLVGAFGQVGSAASGAASAVWGAANRMIAAMEAVQAAATGSPELKIHHSFERFEKYLRNTDYGAMISRQMAMPDYMTQVSAAAPLASSPSTTTIDRSINTGDIVGSSLDTEDEVVETMTRVIRMADATSGT